MVASGRLYIPGFAMLCSLIPLILSVMMFFSEVINTLFERFGIYETTELNWQSLRDGLPIQTRHTTVFDLSPCFHRALTVLSPVLSLCFHRARVCFHLLSTVLSLLSAMLSLLSVVLSPAHTCFQWRLGLRSPCVHAYSVVVLFTSLTADYSSIYDWRSEEHDISIALLVNVGICAAIL